VWDIRYRPLVFDEVLGQQGAVQVLQARLKAGRAFDTSYVFAGGHGSGKTTLARILARAMLCQNPGPDGNPCNECEQCRGCLDESLDAFTELDAASNGTTSHMRDLVDGLAYNIPGVQKRIYLLDEAHRMSRDGQDVLLKAIEDKRLVAIFCTTELPKIRGTIKSRCEVHEIRKIPREDILARMQMVLESEKVEYEDDAVLTVIDLAQGHVRDVLNQLETVAQTGPVTKEAVREALNLSVVSTYFEVLLSLGDPSRAVSLVEGACDRVGPSAVAVGLAEAAMNSYRAAHKIHTDFTHFDQALAERVYEAFGDTLPGLAEYFLRLDYVTQLHLICDVVRLCEGGGVPVQTPVAVAPPVKVAPQPAPAPAPALPVAEETPALPAAEEAPTPESKGASSSNNPPPSENLPPVDPVREKDKRADGFGPVGSSDPHALTKFDHLAIPSKKPRDRRREERATRKVTKKAASDRPLTNAEFRVKLLNLLGMR
jgi:DNA polymerase III subunit gamma/tau